MLLTSFSKQSCSLKLNRNEDVQTNQLNIRGDLLFNASDHTTVFYFPHERSHCAKSKNMHKDKSNTMLVATFSKHITLKRGLYSC